MNMVGENLSSKALASNINIETNEHKENITNIQFSCQTSLESEDMENKTIDDWNHISMPLCIVY